MPIDLILSPDRPNNPFEQYRRTLLKALAAVRVPTIGSWPDAEDFEAVRDHIREVADLADAWLRSVGCEVESNVTHNINKSCFDGAFAGAVDGWSTYECERAAEIIREDGVS
jgi:hypothetical protein